MTAEWSRIVDALRKGCTGVGLDLVQPFAAAVYNRAVPPEWRIEDFGRPRALGVLFGNTRALWQPFLRAVAAEAELAADQHPLERYLRERLVPLVTAASDRRHRLYWAHETRPALPIQRLAELVGLASLSPSHLSIHPQHGPWLALRAVLVLDVDGPDAPAPALESPCPACHKPCLPALERALGETGAELGSATIAANAGAWIAVRDACPVGRASRYGERQLCYHYTKDRKLLRDGIDER